MIEWVGKVVVLYPTLTTIVTTPLRLLSQFKHWLYNTGWPGKRFFPTKLFINRSTRIKKYRFTCSCYIFIWFLLKCLCSLKETSGCQFTLRNHYSIRIGEACGKILSYLAVKTLQRDMTPKCQGSNSSGLIRASMNEWVSKGRPKEGNDLPVHGRLSTEYYRMAKGLKRAILEKKIKSKKKNQRKKSN